MKANAPEKIYLYPYSTDGIYEVETKPLEGTSEYTRTDTFMKKAVKYLYDYNQNMVKKHGAKAVLGCSEFTINVDEFKKYMEK